MHEPLQRRRHAAHGWKQVEEQQGCGRHHDAASHGVDHDRQDMPGNRGGHIPRHDHLNRCAGKHEQITQTDGTRCGQVPRRAARNESANHHASDHRHEQPCETVARYAEQVDQKRRRAGDVDEKCGEVQRRYGCEQQKIAIAQHADVVAPQIARMKRLSLRDRQSLWEPFCRPGHQ